MKKLWFKKLGMIVLFVMLMTPNISVAAQEDDPGRERLSGEGFEDAEEAPDLYLHQGMQVGDNARGIMKLFQSPLGVGNSPFMNDTYMHTNPLSYNGIRNGIDVSKYQKNIDWSQVRAAGVEFAIIRAGYRGYGEEGNMGDDEYFYQNMSGALSVGIEVGAYVFSQATTELEAIQEAEYLLNKIQGFPITMPVVIDYEYASVGGGAGGRLYDAKLTKSQATNVCMAFCQRVAAAGYEPMIYANSTMLNNQLDAATLSANYKIWLANYTTQTDYNGIYHMWQYTSKGAVPGIIGNVDCNFLYVVPQNVTEPTLTLSAQNQSTTTVELTWQKPEDTTGYEVVSYEIQVYNPEYQQYMPLVSIYEPNTTTYLHENLTPGTEYKYRIIGNYILNYQSMYGTPSPELTTATLPEKLNNLTSPSRTDTRIRLNWDKVEGAMGYQIYEYIPDLGIYQKNTTISDSDTLTFVDTQKLTGKTYKYKVRAFLKAGGKNYFGAFSTVIVTGTKPENPIDLKSTAQTTTKIALSWKKVTGSNGYEVYRGKGGVYTKVKTMTSASTTAYTNGSLNKNTSYKYKVRAYKVIDGIKYYGTFSDIIKVTTKKK